MNSWILITVVKIETMFGLIHSHIHPEYNSKANQGCTQQTSP